MNKHTEPKSGTPIARMAAGIAAAAAVLTVTGGFGYLLLSMREDVPHTPANTESEIADQSAAYISYFRDYYELRAGHPVDFDFSTLCGTDFDETWEMDDCTVTLNAAICDGYEIDYIYTIEKDSPVTYDEDGFAEIPVLNLRPNDTIPHDQRPVTAITDMIDTVENEDGTYSIRFIGSYQHTYPDTPISPEEDFYVQCLPRSRDRYQMEAASMRADEDENARPVSVSIPEEIPEYQALSAPLSVVRYASVNMPVSDDFTMAVVTPISVRLVNYPPEEFADVYEQMTIKGQNHANHAIDKQSVTVQKSISGQEPQDVDLVIWDDDSKIGRWCYGSHITVKSEGYEPAITYAADYLSFIEPLDLSNIDYLTFGSERTDAVTLPVNGEASAEEQDTPDQNLITAETEEFPPFNILNAQWRTKEYGFGFVTAEGISYDENDNPVMDLTIILNKSFSIEEGDKLSLRMTPIGYGDNGNRYEIRNDEVMQGFKWTTEAQADENGEYHVQLTLDPLSKAYYWVQDEDGEYVSQLGNENEAIYWETLNIELHLNELYAESLDGSSKSYATGEEDGLFLKFRFGTALYHAIEDIPEAARTRHIEFADVRLEDATRNGNIVEMKFGVKLDDSVAVQEGDTIALVPFVVAWDSNFEVIAGNSIDSEYTVTEPDADGWYHFYETLDISDLPETEQAVFNCSVQYLRIHRGNEGIVYDVNPHTSEEVKATLFARFSVS